MKKNKVLLCLMMVLLILGQSLLFSVSATSKGKYKRKYSQPYFTNPIYGLKQHRFIYITTPPVWTKYKFVANQPRKGTYLNKGDGLYYGESGGSSASVSFSLGYAGMSVSMDVPLGKVSDYYGTFKRANKRGYYKIKAKKQIIPTIWLIQYRDTPYSKWSKGVVYNKTYKVNRVVPVLQKIK